MTPRVSVVISTYNRPEKLEKAIQSVKNQTYTDWEIIVSHDDKCSIPSEPNIRHLGAEHFGNDTRPKNHGIQHAKGELIAFLDDDNQFRPDHLAALVSAFNKNPETDIAYGQRWLIDESGNIPPQTGMTSEYEPGLLMERNYIDTSDVLVRKSALMKVGGFDERYSKYIDWNLWVRMEKSRMHFTYVPLNLTDYYLSSDSKSVKKLTSRETDFMKKTGKFINLPDWDAVNLEIELPYLGEVKEPRVAIFSLTYDRLDYTKRCFESLEKTAGYPYDHYVIDNGSTDGTISWLRNTWQDRPGKQVQLNDNNVGISKGSNQALDYIHGSSGTGNVEDFMNYDIIVKVDNDALFLNEGWLKKMVEIWKVNHRLALSCYVQGLRDNPGGAPRLFRGQMAGETIGVTKHLGGICVFVDASAYKDFRWDEESFLHGMQDVEFSQHLTSQGFQMAYLENWFLEHCEGTAGQEKKYPEYFERRKIEKRTRYEIPVKVSAK